MLFKIKRLPTSNIYEVNGLLIIYVVALLYLLIWTMINSQFVFPLKKSDAKNMPRVSILIPLRNEANHVKKLIRSLKGLTYPFLEFVLYDDESTDNTYSLLKREIGQDARFRLVKGHLMPKDWVGKSHACMRLSEHATGDVFCFMDADVTLASSTIEKVITHMETTKSDGCSSFPQFSYTNWLDRLVIPMMHVLVHVYLPLFFANYTKWTSTTAANGAFICFTKMCYERIGGHKSVQHSLIEDIELARNVKRAHMRFTLIRGKNTIFCEMYDSAKATWQGFLKNTFNGLNRSIIAAILYSVFSVIVLIVPFGLLVYGLGTLQWVYILPYWICLLIRMVSDFYAGSKLHYAFFYPISQLFVLCILWQAVYLSVTKHSIKWKGREYT